MSATDDLRKLLDERGIIHKTDTFVIDADHGKVKETAWVIGNSHYVYQEYRDRTVMTSTPITPEQAIAATLGRETCKLEPKDNLAETEGYGDVWLECSACNCRFDFETSGKFNYCPNCGRAAKQ